MDIQKLTITYRGQFLEIEYFLRPGKERTLLFLHGGACSKHDFLEATQRENLKNHTIIAFDFPGCGNSPYPQNQHFDIDDLVEITKQVIEKLELRNITLIGHSTGGLVAMLYISKYNNIAAFINIEGNLAPENIVFSRKVVESASFDEFKNKVFVKLRQDLASSENTGFQKWAESLQTVSPQAFYDYCKLLVVYSDSGEILKQYLELKIPSLYIHGSENTERLKFLTQIQKQGGRTAEISKSNHFPFYDNPDEFYNVIFNFLSKI